MATIVLSAAGAAVGGSIGGTLAGLSSVAVGRAVGASLGRLVDQRLLGQGGQAVETGKVDRFRLTGSGEGAAIPKQQGGPAAQPDGAARARAVSASSRKSDNHTRRAQPRSACSGCCVDR